MTSSFKLNSFWMYSFKRLSVLIRSEKTIMRGEDFLPVQPILSNSCLNLISLEKSANETSSARSFNFSSIKISAVWFSISPFRASTSFWIFLMRCVSVSTRACGLDRNALSRVTLKRDSPRLLALNFRFSISSKTNSSFSDALIRTICVSLSRKLLPASSSISFLNLLTNRPLISSLV